ncbi:hypothetical protein F5Y15DRAFT_82819 [Xylariaceae sp. FL0016]|nr:hypothetical protein F5Y15DRAFT_82819 [Xylariaceae sp. FL0016]
MGDLKARIKAKLLRRNSATPSLSSSLKNSLGRGGSSSTHTQATGARSLHTGYSASDEHSDNARDSRSPSQEHRKSPKSIANGHDGVKAGEIGTAVGGRVAGDKMDETDTTTVTSAPLPAPLANSTNGSSTANTTMNTCTTTTTTTTTTTGNDLQISAPPSTITTPCTPSVILPCINEHPANAHTNIIPNPAYHPIPKITATRTNTTNTAATDETISTIEDHLYTPAILTPSATSSPFALTIPPSSPQPSRPSGPTRKQSILPDRQTTLIKALLHSGHAHDPTLADPDQFLPIHGNMVTRKIWVKRPLASATLITINENDLVDDVRDLILRKYANSLGRQFDSPDLTLRICDRTQGTSRTLQPDEPMGRVLDAYYSNGQAVDDALLIDIPSRRTPKASPNPRFYGDDRPHESGTDYFPPYPPASHTHHAGPAASTTSLNGPHTTHFPQSMAIIGNGQLPPLPSPGGTRRLGAPRPKITRMHTASPVSTAGTTQHSHASHNHSSQSVAPPTGTQTYPRPPRSRTHSGASSDQSNHQPAAPQVPTPPPAERVATPPPQRVASPRPSARAKKTKKAIEHPSLPPGMLDGAVPPINVLIVEDNIINLKLLEAFVKRLKVRWQTAMNGKEAVQKWRAGGFHLVLMDIQLPVMNGLDATREIRRIEKVNSIGVFSSSASSPPDGVLAEPAEEDKLANTEMFKSPVIIVALTASSLQSDRHEALAAGCNDFLTKPVNFVWLERKVKEWGCMQALIDFDGWRKWKDFSQKEQENEATKKALAAKPKAAKKNRLSMTTAAA